MAIRRIEIEVAVDPLPVKLYKLYGQMTAQTIMTNPNEEQRETEGRYIGLGVALGAGIGTALGVALGTAFGNLAIGIAIGTGCGVAIGVAIGISIAASKKSDQGV